MTTEGYDPYLEDPMDPGASYVVCLDDEVVSLTIGDCIFVRTHYYTTRLFLCAGPLLGYEDRLAAQMVFYRKKNGAQIWIELSTNNGSAASMPASRRTEPTWERRSTTPWGFRGC